MKQFMVKGLVIVLLLMTFSVVVAKDIYYQNVPEAGLSSLMIKLEKLPVVGTVMTGGAHPDDESNALLAYLAKGLGLHTSYLVANWGEGGQNEIGPELYDALGVVRSQELLAARAIDGAYQVYLGPESWDYGYSKTADEAISTWGYDAVFENMVRVIRQERPDVFISSHNTTSGHGHHQAFGVIVLDAYFAAADPNCFPEQITEEGLLPWQIKKLYFRSRETTYPDAPTTIVQEGAFDLYLGMSYNEVGALARGNHKCQGMSANPQPGPSTRTLYLLESTVGFHTDSVMEGIDTSVMAIAADAIGSQSTITKMHKMLSDLNGICYKILGSFNVFKPLDVLDDLLAGVDLLKELRVFVERSGDLTPNSKTLILDRIDLKTEDFLEAIRELLGIALVVDVSDANVVRGQAFNVTVTFWNRSDADVRDVRLSLNLPEGWKTDIDYEDFTAAGNNERIRTTFEVTVGEDADYTEPWDDRKFLLPDPISATASFAIGNTVLDVETSPELRVVPIVSVALDPKKVMVPETDEDITREISIRLRNGSPGSISGTVHLEAPDGWTVEFPDHTFTIANEDGETSVSGILTVPAGTEADEFIVTAVALVDGREYDVGFQVISYPHINTNHYYTPSSARVAVIDVEIPEDLKVGFIDGGFDEVYIYLEQMGADVTMLTPAYVATGDLSVFDTIVLGIRCLMVRDDVVANSGRFLDYVYNGGNIVATYHKTVRQGEWKTQFAPYELDIGRDRVTQPDAPVTHLVPDHVLLNEPNRITDADWEGWLQERGLYFPNSWGPEWTELVAMTDPNEPLYTGSWLVAEYGQGTYIYTALGWYRQLDNLVPGGYRAFGNMISLPRVK